MDFSQFVPEVLAGLLTGLVVGLAVLRAQTIATNREIRLQAEYAWLALIPKARLATSALPVPNARDLRVLPARMARLFEVASLAPLQQWKRLLNHPEIDLLVAMTEAVERYQAFAELLDPVIDSRILVRKSTLRSPAPTERFSDEQLGLLVRCRVLGLPPQTVRAVVTNDEELLGLADQAAKTVLDDPLVNSTIVAFQREADNIAQAFDVLAKALAQAQQQTDPLTQRRWRFKMGTRRRRK